MMGEKLLLTIIQLQFGGSLNLNFDHGIPVILIQFHKSFSSVQNNLSVALAILTQLSLYNWKSYVAPLNMGVWKFIRQVQPIRNNNSNKSRPNGARLIRKRNETVGEEL